MLRPALALALVLGCAACGGGGRYATRWDGRRGYDGNGDYGYDVAASRAEARTYQARVAANYPQPGPADDAWGPYVHEAAARFQVPERWIREVMRQESGGHQYDSSGAPITSSAGAMGLMQVMPRTYDVLRARYGLGGDPYDPHDNILAGTAYIREMYAVYGSPGFLAAYNAGPDRLDAYLSGGGPLPDETVNYLASVAPRLGTEVAASGPLAVYAGSGAAVSASDRAYAGGGMTGPAYAQSAVSPQVADDPADRAFEGGGLVTPAAPTGAFIAPAAPTGAFTAPAARVPAVQLAAVPAVAAPAMAVVAEPLPARPVSAPAPTRMAAISPFGRTQPDPPGWGIQVGAFPDPGTSQTAIERALADGGGLLAGARSTITPVERGGVLYRARLVGLSAASASAACGRLAGQGLACFAVPPGS